MRKTWIVMLLSAIICSLLSGCTQPASSPPAPDKQQTVQQKLRTGVHALNQTKVPDDEALKPAVPSEKLSEDISSQNNSNSAAGMPDPNQPLFTYPDAVRGIYMTGHSAGGAKFSELLSLIDQTDLNAVVIDIKDDYGKITYKMEGPLAAYSEPYIKDPKQLMKILAEHKIYPIARVVVFKDSILARNHPELSFMNKGQVWKNPRGEAFVNPFMKKVWEHNIAIAKEAAKLGFQEIQFDYVRFPEGFEKRDKVLSYSMGDYSKEKLEPRLLAEWEQDKANWEQSTRNSVQLQQSPPSQAMPAEHDATQTASTQPVVMTAKPSTELSSEKPSPTSSAPKTLPEEPQKPVYDAVKARVTAVTDFVQYAKKELEPFDVKVSVDIFGYTATLPEAPGIGQNFTSISQNVDVISSMIYPSHWGPGYFNIPKPDIDPYKLVQEYVKMEKQKLLKLDNPPISRPWIQDFTASWLGKGNYISYGKKEVEAQIRALNEAGIHEFLLWNANNNFTPGVDYTPLK